MCKLPSTIVSKEVCSRGKMKKRLYRLHTWMLVVGMLLLATTLSAQSPAELNAFRAAVEEIFEKRDVACLESNLTGYVSIWDENAIRLSSDNPAVLGLSAIRDNQRKAFQNWFFQEVDTNIEEAHLSGDFGWTHGTYWVQLRSKAGGNWFINKGTILTVFRKQDDGSWRIYCDVMISTQE